jgi:heterodisulfide reductase subunit B2
VNPVASDVVRVNFAFKRELARKIEGNLASFCYQCGACVGDCPAALYSKRTFNPREIMLKVLYGLETELLGEDTVLWQCTNCYNCHERCPQQVKPVEAIISLKNMLADRGLAPVAAQKVNRTFLTGGRTTPMSSAVERQREQLGLPPLSAPPVDEIQRLVENGTESAGADMASSPTVDVAAVATPRHKHNGRAEPIEPDGHADRAQASGTSAETSTRRYAFFPGCLIPTRHPAMELAIRKTLGRLGVEIVDLEGTSCCPDPIYFKAKDKLAWVSIAARNLTLAEDLGLDVFTNCSGCTATLSETHHLLEDPTLRERVNERLGRIGRAYHGTTSVRHVATLLRDVVGYDAIRASVVRPLTGLKVAIHYGCHLLKPSRIMRVDDPNDPSVMEHLVAALGATPVRHRNWSLCCGKACQSEDIPNAMMRDLLRSVADEQAELMCLICPTCFGQFDYGQASLAQKFGEDFRTPPLYYFQLLAFAQGTPYDQLGCDRQRLKPECLRRFE